jgi:hypothetical protein
MLVWLTEALLSSSDQIADRLAFRLWQIAQLREQTFV